MDTGEKMTFLIAEEDRNRISSALLSKVRSVEAGGAGDCFYYALFEALRKQNLLDRVALGTEKQAFVDRFRSIISQKADSLLIELYRLVCEARATEYHSDDAFGEYIRTSEYPTWLSELLIKTFTSVTACLEHVYDSEEVQRFIRRAKYQMLFSGNYVSSIEPRVAQEHLRSLGIVLDIKNRLVRQLLNVKDRIVLRNIDAGHYQYYEFIESDSAKNINDAFSVVTKKEAPVAAPAPTATRIPGKLPPSIPLSEKPATTVSNTTGNTVQLNAVPNGKPNPKPNAVPNAKPNEKPNAKPIVKPNAVPNTKPNEKPNAKPNGKPNVKQNTYKNTTRMNRKFTSKFTSKLHRQIRRIQAAYQYLLDEVERPEE
jgi:hypothetical protein